jgi:hypothetical protein
MQHFKILSRLILSTLPVIFFFCTESDKLAGTVDDTDTGISVYLPDSTPAVNAVIKFIPSTRSQTTGLNKKLKTSSAAVAVVKTDSTGRFKVPALADSTYNIFMEKGDLKAFQGEVVITSQGNTIHDDTLRKTGSFTATVGLDPKDMHNVGSVAVQILGSDVQYLNPDKKGLFTFKDIAPGNYKLRLETSLPEYSPTYFTMTIKSNIDSIYPNTIFLKYTGIPSVHGLSAQFDTSSGIVKLSWDSTEYSNILDYVVFRDAEPTVTYSSTPYKATSATSLVDTIFNVQKNPIDSHTLGFKYRVAIRNNSTVIGNTFGAASVTATPYKSVLPQIDSIKVTFDTLSGTAVVSWKSVPSIDSSYDYTIIRNIKDRPLTGFAAELQNVVNTVDTINHLSSATFLDSLFGKKLAFNSLSSYSICYTISVFKKDWKLYGKEKKSDSLLIIPYKTRVPQITGLYTTFDTLHGVSFVSWDSIPAATGVSKYRVIRTVTRLLQPPKIDTLPLSANYAFIDTIYPNLVTFDEINQVKVSYIISAFHSAWNIYGIEKTITNTVFSYKAFPPKISAGMDQTVDISSDVLLVGRTISATFPVIKREWKIGDGAWVDGGDTIQFRTNSEHTREMLPCLFRVSDNVGNIAIDTMTVMKTPLVVTLSKFPSKQGTSVIEKINSTTEFLHIGEIDYNKYGVWSTTDLKNYKLLTSNPGITGGQFFKFQNNYYIYNISDHGYIRKSFKSSDAITWSEITPIISQGTTTAWSPIVPLQDKMIGFSCNYRYNNQIENIIYKSTDGIIWDSISNILPQESLKDLFKIGDTLCLVSNVNKYKSSDGGITWKADKFWDTDGDLFPDNFYSSAYSDSVIVVAYQERPSQIKRMAMFRNGIWKVLPTDILDISPNTSSNFTMIVLGNRCLIFEYPSSYNREIYSSQSFKLY